MMVMELSGERLHGGLRPPAMIFRQGYETPAHGRDLVPKPIIDVLAVEDLLLLPAQGEIHLPVTQRPFIGAVEYIPIRRIHLEAMCIAPPVNAFLHFHLFPLEILQPLLPPV